MQALAPILITGVGKRIGFALAKHFLQQNIRVIGTYRTHYDTIDELTQSGAELIHCDFYDPASVDSLIKTVRSSHTMLRAVIHNASDWEKEDFSISDQAANLEIFDRMMAVHAKIPYQLNLSFAHLLACNLEQADIIHISDFVATKGDSYAVGILLFRAIVGTYSSVGYIFPFFWWDIIFCYEEYCICSFHNIGPSLC